MQFFFVIHLFPPRPLRPDDHACPTHLFIRDVPPDYRGKATPHGAPLPLLPAPLPSMGRLLANLPARPPGKHLQQLPLQIVQHLQRSMLQFLVSAGTAVLGPNSTTERSICDIKKIPHTGDIDSIDRC